MRPCIITHQYCRPMPLKERNSFRLQNLVNVTLSIEVALRDNEICFPSAHNATPYHNTPTSKSVPLDETIISKTFPSSSKNRVPRGSVVKCLTRNPGVLGSSRTRSSGFFRGSVLGQDTSEPSLVLVKPRKDMNNVSCRLDMTEILLKVA